MQCTIIADNPTAYADTRMLYVEVAKKLVPYFIESLAIQKNTAVLYVDDISHIDQALEMVGKKLFLPLTEKQAPTEEQQFINNMIGFLVMDTKAGEIGTIKQIFEYPQQLIASVDYQEQEILFPLTEALIKKIDQKKKNITVTLPEGLLDVYLKKDSGNEEHD